MKKSIALAILLFLLSPIQTSLLPHIALFGFVPNILAVAVFLIVLLESPSSPLGIQAALLGGFFLDLFSTRVFGFWIFALLFPTLFIKYIVLRYVRLPFFKTTIPA